MNHGDTYPNIGKYYNKVKNYLDVFGRNNVMVLLFDDIAEDTDGALEKIYNFLGLPIIQLSPSKKIHNPSGRPRFKFLSWLIFKENLFQRAARILLPFSFRLKIGQTIKKFNLKKEPMSRKLRNELNDMFREDIIKTAELIDRDLSIWL